MGIETTQRARQALRARKRKHLDVLAQEMQRLAKVAAAVGVQKVVVFGSAAKGEAGLSSDLDLLIVWDTPLAFLDRTVALYQQLAPQIAVDLLVYTPDEMQRMRQTPFIQRALAQGKVLYEA